MRDPNLHKESWWYFDLDAKRNKGLKAGDKVDRGPRYYDGDDHDTDIDGTLKSARYAEGFYGVRHPNKFTGEFDQDGNHLVSGESSGKGLFKNKAAHASLLKDGGLDADGSSGGQGSVSQGEAEVLDANGVPVKKSP